MRIGVIYFDQSGNVFMACSLIADSAADVPAKVAGQWSDDAIASAVAYWSTGDDGVETFDAKPV